MKIAFLSDNYMPGRSSLDPFRALLLKASIQTSAELLYVQCNDYLGADAVVRESRGQEHIIRSLKRFNPELIFSLNRAGLTSDVVHATGAKIVSWYIDNPDRTPKELRQFGKNEVVHCATRFQIDWLKQEHPELTQVGYLPFCTDETLFHPDANIADSNKCDVSFVGTLWDPGPFLEFVTQVNRNDQDRAFFMDGLARYQNDYLSDFPRQLAERLRSRNEIQVRNYLNDFLSSRRRLAVMDRLSDLKLEIYGNTTWDAQSLLRGDALYSRFRLEPIETPEQLSALYRRTRVAISIAHQQAQTGFPIRVFDLFASGVPLVSDPHEEIDALFGNEAYLKADSAEAYSENVRRLLDDKSLAKAMSERSRAEVLSKHTFTHRLSTAYGKTLSKVGAGKVEVVSENFDASRFSKDPALHAFPFTRRSIHGNTQVAAVAHRSPLQKALGKSGEMFSFLTGGISKRIRLTWLSFCYLLTAIMRRRAAKSGNSFNRVAKSYKKTAVQMLDTLDAQISYLSKEISELRKKEEG